MKLTKDQKRSLEQLKNHEGYKVLELIEKEAREDLWAFLLTSDLNNKEDLEIIQKNQLYVKARKDFLENINTHVQEIYTPEV